MNRCVIIGGADIADYGRIRRSLRSSDFCIYCDSGLNHEEGIGMKPNLIVHGTAVHPAGPGQEAD